MKNSNASQTRAGTKPPAPRSQRGNGKPAAPASPAPVPDVLPGNRYAIAALAEAVDGPRSPLPNDSEFERYWSDAHDEEVITCVYQMEAIDEIVRREGMGVSEFQSEINRMIPVLRQLPALRQVALALESIVEAIDYLHTVQVVGQELRKHKTFY